LGGCHAVVIDPFLNGDMSLRFKLKVAFPPIAAVVALHGALDIDGMGVVPLDEVAVVTVHRPHEISQGLCDGSWQPAAKGGGFLRQFKRKIVQLGAGRCAFRNHERLEQPQALAIVLGRHLSVFLATSQATGGPFIFSYIT